MFFFVRCIPPTKTSQQKGVRRTRRTLKNPRGVIFFEREDVKETREYLRQLILPYRPPQPIDGPLRLDLLFVFPYLKSTPKRLSAEGLPDYYLDTPDWDNAAKGVADILQRDAFIVADSRITFGRVLEARGPEELQGIGVSITVMPPAHESPLLRKVRERILEYQRTHPNRPGTCPRCWHAFGRAIPEPPSGERCFNCGRLSERLHTDEPFDDVDLFAEDTGAPIDPDDLFAM